MRGGRTSESDPDPHPLVLPARIVGSGGGRGLIAAMGYLMYDVSLSLHAQRCVLLSAAWVGA